MAMGRMRMGMDPGPRKSDGTWKGSMSHLDAFDGFEVNPARGEGRIDGLMRAQDGGKA